MDIKYNRSEGIKTVVSQNKTTDDGDSMKIAETEDSPLLNVQSKTTARLNLNDNKYIETTVVFMPNIWTLMPNSIEYEQILDTYKRFIDEPDYLPPDFLNAPVVTKTSPLQNNENQEQTQSTQEQSIGLNASDIKALIFFTILSFSPKLLLS